MVKENFILNTKVPCHLIKNSIHSLLYFMLVHLVWGKKRNDVQRDI